MAAEGTGGIPDDATEDVPPSESRDGDAMQAAPAPTPEQRHAWGVENFRNQSASSFVNVCIFLVVVLAVASVFFPDGKSGVVDSVVDMLKVVTTTSLGYLFGKSR
ncbi:hypothetical protein PSRA_0813 [Pseudoscardovia radai]|uniref:Uncharacterized protein n=1 Tax=Pseudoscardovia radai TaxID=987066 RepID=A0A261EY17_9BIFI|nr:hypothetical protein [Pseudoscardovia radai]MDO5688435.1 hypothetical protein [Pseudoscardovia radai]OZG51733.1 hypothetical protein PSRA_0813 [Pseudoscardovia radai]